MTLIFVACLFVQDPAGHIRAFPPLDFAVTQLTLSASMRDRLEKEVQPFSETNPYLEWERTAYACPLAFCSPERSRLVNRWRWASYSHLCWDALVDAHRFADSRARHLGRLRKMIGDSDYLLGQMPMPR